MPTEVKNINKGEEYDIYIGRAGRGKSGLYGSPIVMYKPCPECGIIHRTNKSTIPCYKQWINRHIEKHPDFKMHVKKLKGKKLGCFCKPKACHGDVLADLAERL